MGILYHNNSEQCNVGRRCKKYRACETCNKIRQAQHADLTSLAGRFSAHSQYCVIMPYADGQHRINEIKTKITRKIKPISNGALISVETSKNSALHLNIILNSDKLINQNIITKSLGKMGVAGSVFIDKLNTDNEIRRATAYSCKLNSIPNKEQYQGNIINTTGNIRTIRQAHQSKSLIENQPYIAIASFNSMLKKLGFEFKDISTTPQQTIKSILHLSNEISKLGCCYSRKYGVMNIEQFNEVYQNYIKHIN